MHLYKTYLKLLIFIYFKYDDKHSLNNNKCNYIIEIIFKSCNGGLLN